MADPIIYHPKKEYPKYKGILHEHAREYFDNLVKESKIDEEGNRLHVKQYNTQLNIQRSAEKRLSGARTGLTFAIIGIVFLFLAAFICFFVPFIKIENLWWFFLISLALLTGAIVLLVFTIVSIGKKVKSSRDVVDKEKKKSQELLNICYKDLETLNNSFDYLIPTRLMDDVIDILKMDDYLDNIRLTDLVQNYKFEAIPDINGTTLNVLSGEMLNNPFVLIDSRSRFMAPRMYTGRLVVTVRVRRTDSKGRSYYSTETQTLVATSYHPAPNYVDKTSLYYANEAAPNLIFSRNPSKASSMDAKGQEKYVRNHMKDILKQSETALKKGKSNFTPTGNDAFDVFFGANNRTNEIEFRLLYTALAQQNTLDLICDPSPFGDDFTFKKNKKINIISSSHSQRFNYFWSLDNYRDYDIDHSREKFLTYVDDYFEALYFDFAPLLSIPLYQMHKGHPVKESLYNYNYSMIEHEVMANKLDVSNFRVSTAALTERTMLSYKKAKKVGNIDVVTLNASSYETFPEVDMVPCTARDGSVHLVPVHWTRYEEVNEDKYFALYHANISKADFVSKLANLPTAIPIDKMHFERGFIAFPLEKDVAPGLSEKLDNLFTK